MKLLKLKEGEKPFEYGVSPNIMFFDARGVVVDDTQVEKLTNMFPLVAVDVEEQTPVIEEVSIDESTEIAPEEIVEEQTPVKTKKTKK